MRDIEDIVFEIETFFKENLNDKIVEINTEKGNFALKQVDVESYLFGDLNDSVTNFDPFFFHYVEDVSSVVSGPNTAKLVTHELAIIFADGNEDKGAISRRVLRYLRALEETASDAYGEILGGNRIEISQLAPLTIQFNNSSVYHKVVGIQIEFDFA